MPLSPPHRDLVFVSYSHADRVWLDRLQLLLKPFVRQGSLVVWADPYVETGEVFHREIGSALARAAVGVCLVSPHFAASDFIAEVEIPALVDAAERGELTIFCVPVVAVSLKAVLSLAKYQWVRDPDQPLEQLAEAERNRALVEIVDKLVAAVERRVGEIDSRIVERAVNIHVSATLDDSFHAERMPVEPVVIRANETPGRLHGVPDLPLHHLPREDDLARLKRSLLEGTSGAVGITAAAYRLGLHGQGGIGKSVLAAALAHHDEVRRAFPDGVFWVALGQTPDLLRLQSELLRAAGGESVAATSVEDARRVLRNVFAERACLLVVDDAWDVQHARAFDVLGPRSRVLVTTRDAAVLTALGAKEEPIQRLPEGAALQLLATWAGVNVEALPEAAHGVARECGFLPLALSVAGALVKDGVGWGDLLQALKEGHVEFLDHPHGNVFRSLRLSVDALPDGDRKRYLDLAVFPEEERVPESVVLKLWRVTTGMQPFEAKALLTRLERKALLEITRSPDCREIVLHDLQHDFLRLVAENLLDLHRELLRAFAEGLPPGEGGRPSWAALPASEPYPWLHLGEHLLAAGRGEEFRQLLLNYRWLEAKLDAAGLSALLADFEHFPGDEDLYLVAETLRVSAHVLARDPAQLPSQLCGRLLGVDRPRIQALLGTVGPTSSRAWLRLCTASLTPPASGLLRTLEGHSGMVMSVAVSADGRRAVSGSYDGTVRVWDVESGQGLHTLEGHSGRVLSVAVSADGRRAVSGSSDGTVRVWDLEGGQGLRTLEGHSGVVLSVAVSADGRRAVSGSEDGTVRVWDVESGQWLHTLEGHSDWVTSVAVSADGRRVVSGSYDGTVRVWDVESGQWLRTLEGHWDGVRSVAVSADGRRAVSGSYDRTVRVWDVESGQGLRMLEARWGGVRSVAVSTDGRRVVSGSDDGEVRVWDVESGHALRTVEQHSGGVGSVVVSADGRRAVSGSQDAAVRVWDLDSGQGLRTLECHSGWVWSVAVSTDGRRVVSGSDYGRVQIWDVESGQVLRTLEGHSGAVRSVAVSVDGTRAVSGASDRTMRVWDMESGDMVAAFLADGPVHSCVFAPSGAMVVMGDGVGGVHFLRLEKGSVEEDG